MSARRLWWGECLPVESVEKSFAYRPGEGACLGCLEMVLERSQYRDKVREIDLVSGEEREAMYGLPVAEIKDSPGLNVDIAFITNFHTRAMFWTRLPGVCRSARRIWNRSNGTTSHGATGLFTLLTRHFQIQPILCSGD